MALPEVQAGLLAGRRGLIAGVANERAIAWGCARAFRALGAEVAMTYLDDATRRFAEPLAREVEAPIFVPLDVSVPGQMEAAFERIAEAWGSIDCLIHSIAFSPCETLQGRIVDADRKGLLTTMDVSCWSFPRMAHLAEPWMPRGGARCSR